MLAVGLNILWLILGGGLAAGLLWIVAGVIMVVTVIGIPWARAAFNLALFSFWPFGRDAVNRRDLTGEEDVGTGTPGFLGNVIWFLLAGIWLAIGHVVLGLGLCVTVIGIPFGLQHFKLAGASLAPIGKAIVPNAVAAEIARRRAAEVLDERRAA